MKKELLIALSTCITTLPIYANSTEQGLSGEIGLFAVHHETESHLSTEDDKVLNSLNDERESESMSSVVPLGSIQYQFGDHQLFVGQSEDTFVRGVFALEIGYRNQLSEDSAFTLAVAPTIMKGEVWENPYLVGSEREKTDIEGNAYRFKYEYQFVSMNLAYYDREVDTEAAPDKRLHRDGDGYFTSLALSLPLSMATFIEPSVFYQVDDADGKAMAFDRYGAGLMAAMMLPDYSFVLESRFSSSEYDASHPIFGKVREEDKFNASLSFEYKGIFGIRPVSLLTQIAYEETDANIDFYDEEEVSVLLGALYRF